MFAYLIINILVVSVPFAFSFERKVAFYRLWRYCLPAILITSILFIGWDVIFHEAGVWGFNGRYLTGLRILNIPVEEWLFFITIPYAVLFTYRVLNVWVPMREHPEMQRMVSYTLLILFLTAGILCYNRLYSVVTFVLAGLFVLITEWVLKSYYLLHFYRTFLVILFPFLITNGFLTGSGLEEPVVWYNDSMNSGFRIFTIPIEDVAYGFILLGINIALTERFVPGKISRPKIPGFV